jgi:hypothetical protein
MFKTLFQWQYLSRGVLLFLVLAGLLSFGFGLLGGAYMALFVTSFIMGIYGLMGVIVTIFSRDRRWLNYYLILFFLGVVVYLTLAELSTDYCSTCRLWSKFLGATY